MSAGAVITGLALVATACGARTAPYLGGDAAGTPGGAANGIAPGTGAGGQAGAPAGGSKGALSGGGSAGPAGGTLGGATGGGAGPGGGQGGSSPSSAGGTAGGQASSPAASGLTQSNFPFDPRAEAALCTGTAGNTASDQGVTPTSITFGNVSGLTGVLSNNFNQGPEAVQSLFDAIDAAGGICGRQLKLNVEDDGQDSTKNSADVADLAPRVFAFVGSTSDADNGGVQEMQNAKTPDIGFGINPNRGQSPEYWSAGGTSQYFQNGHPYIYNSLPLGLKAAGNYPSKLAVLAYSIPISADAGQEFQRLFAASGSSICFTDYSISPATTSLDQDVLQMKNKGCTGVYTTMDVTGNAKLLDAMQRQNFSPVWKATTFDGYTPAQISVAGQSAAQGFEVGLPFVPLSDNNPVINEYLSELHTYEPGKDPSGFGVEAWASAEMLVYALVKAGHNPTRAGVVSIFNALTNWNTGGATAPYTPRTHYPAGPCTTEAVAKGSDFTRKWPSSGFFCQGQLTQVG
ncbi:MAG TPA: ABC transporter substrate-binding protein [Acidimicrobiales bacterium]